MSDPTPPEQGMDEILASIRRIIADEEPAAVPAKSVWTTGPLVLTRRVSPPPLVVPAPQSPAASWHEARASVDDGDLADAVVGEPSAPEVHPAQTRLQDGEISESRDPVVTVVETPVIEATPIVHPDAPFKETQTLVTAKQSVPEPAIVGENAVAGAASSFDKLSDVVRGNVYTPPPIHLPPEGRTLEDLTRDMLLPMLKAWLDEHLPAIVEARVDEEVERISRRRVR